MKRLMIACIRAYQFALSPFLGQRCRFVPSCSEYTADAIARHGSCKGIGLGVRRLCRCHPWSPGGYDPVP